MKSVVQISIQARNARARNTAVTQQREAPSEHSRSVPLLTLASLTLSASFALACASGTTAPPHSATKLNNPKPESAELARTVVTPTSTTDIPELFEHATREGQAKHYETAAAEFERAFQLDPSGPLADKSLFESA